jgi:hypothetical protein
MKSLRTCLSVIAVGSLFAFAGCGDDDDSNKPSSSAGSSSVGGAPDRALECEVIGELCHEADTGSGSAHDCHETGHEGTVAACVKDFASCIHTCVTDADDLGAGGAGSAPDPRCVALGELCHEVDDKTGPLHECHEIGHIGVAANCASEFDGCATQCLAARALLEAGGGGAGGVGGVTSVGGAANAVAGGGVATGGAGGAGGSP